MTSVLDLDKHTRLLIVVPHPDDETLATGGLIQAALAIGASLRVVIVTDGDNNPWPQRWVEKRWRIDAEARARWGKRRRDEAAAALARLGIAESDARHYGWPDLGLTELLMRDARCEDRLAAEILDFAPTLIVAPSLADLHPDHNALRVMLELAIGRTTHADCRRLGFIVHGRNTEAQTVTVALAVAQVKKKLFSLQAHASQLILSDTRMSEICRRVERFESPDSSTTTSALSTPQRWQMSNSRPAIPFHSRALYLVMKVAERVIRKSIPLSSDTRCSSVTITVDGIAPMRIQLKTAGDTLCIELACEPAVRQIFAKIERLGSRVFIYDAVGWMRVPLI